MNDDQVNKPMDDQSATMDIDMTCTDVSQDIIDLTEEKRVLYETKHNSEYMGVDIDEWIRVVNDSVSFKVSKINSYTRSVYISCIDEVLAYLTSNELLFKTDISTFMRGDLDPSKYIDVMHTRLTSNYIMYKNYCLKHGLRSKAVVDERNDWYTTCVEFLNEDIKCQYTEIIHAILSNASNLMMCSCMQQMAL